MLFWPLLLGFTSSLSACAILIIALNLNQQNLGESRGDVLQCLWDLTWERIRVVFVVPGQIINKINTKNFISWYYTFGENILIKFRIKTRQITLKSLGKFAMHRRDFYSYPILFWIWIYDQKFTSLQLAMTRIIVVEKHQDIKNLQKGVKRWISNILIWKTKKCRLLYRYPSLREVKLQIKSLLWCLFYALLNFDNS